MKRYEKLTRDPTTREEAILSFWKEKGMFERSLEQTRGGPSYVFYEGPPTANGKPHFGHLLPRVYKDLYPRYKTMQGHYVARKGGWDTHGLPVELEVEKEIGVNSKPEIEAYGVERFVERCKASVWRYKTDWEQMIERMGFWIDLENAYVTYTDAYIESVWWALKSMFDRGLLYQGHKTLPYCPRCGTGLSSHEVAQGYQVVQDPSVTVRMPVASDEEADYKVEITGRTSLLVWTTTPWTLPANVALAVSGDAVYVEVEQDGERLIVAKALLERVVEEDSLFVREFLGKDLIGLRYEPPYRLVEGPSAHRVYAADFVNLEDGTGMVHIASAFGEDDYRLGQEVGLPFVQPVDLEGRFTEAFPQHAGEFVKDADPKIIADLEERRILYRQTIYEHEYPFCWRCDTPLLYYAMDSWYIKTTAVKEQMIANNKKIRWYPSHVGEGRLADFLDNLKDWALSRDRYWGTPLNLWVCEACGEITSVGSREELVAHAVDPDAARSVELHRPFIDAVTLRCSACEGTMSRVSYVIDTWFDSGSMHTAQWHYPFENEDRFKESFPADFICEAMEQTRGWFYTLLATSTILYDELPYHNCIATGLGLDAQGLKMSKSKGNVIDTWEMIDKYGADCLRWYFFSSSAPWKSKRLGEADVKEPLYRFLDTLRNSYDFFALYATIDGYDPETHKADEADLSVLDRWIRSLFAATTRLVMESLDGYDALAAARAIESFLEQLSNWYIRSSRRRFWRGGMEPDKIAAYTTLYRMLLGIAKLSAPFTPFITEAIYRQLRTPSDPESVHLCRFPVADDEIREPALEQEMDVARELVVLGHQARNQAQVRVRQPLSRLIVELTNSEKLSEAVVSLVKTELNVEAVEFVATLAPLFEETPSPNFGSLGPRLGPRGPTVATWIKGQSASSLKAALVDGSATIDIGGESIELMADDVTYEADLPAHLVLAEGEGMRVLLDTTLDARLKEKGVVREVVHRIQLARKEAGFEVTDRIKIGYEAESVLAKLVSDNAVEISDEVLAVSMEPTVSQADEFQGTIDIDGAPLRIGLSRVEPEES